MITIINRNTVRAVQQHLTIVLVVVSVHFVIWPFSAAIICTSRANRLFVGLSFLGLFYVVVYFVTDACLLCCVFF